MHKLLLSLGAVTLFTALAVTPVMADNHATTPNKQGKPLTDGQRCNDMADKDKVSTEKRGNYVEDCMAKLALEKKRQTKK